MPTAMRRWKPRSRPWRLDVAGGMTPLARARIAQRLAAKSAELVAMPRGSSQAVGRARLARDVAALIRELRGGAAGVAEIAPAEKALIAIALGLKDEAELKALYAEIQTAMGALGEAGRMNGDVAVLAHRAITRWAQIEEKTDV